MLVRATLSDCRDACGSLSAPKLAFVRDGVLLSGPSIYSDVLLCVTSDVPNDFLDQSGRRSSLAFFPLRGGSSAMQYLQHVSYELNNSVLHRADLPDLLGGVVREEINRASAACARQFFSFFPSTAPI